MTKEFLDWKYVSFTMAVNNHLLLDYYCQLHVLTIQLQLLLVSFRSVHCSQLGNVSRFW